MEFSRPEYWSGYPFPSLGDLPALHENSLPVYLPNPGIEPRSPALQVGSLPAEPQGKPRTLEWVSMPFSSRSSRPRSRTGVSCIAGDSLPTGFIREAPECWWGNLSFLPHGLIHRAVWMLSTLGCWLPKEWVIQEKARQNLPCLLGRSLRGHTPSFPQYPVGYTGQFYSVWERTGQEHKYQDVMITGSQLGSWLSYCHSDRGLK